MRRKARENGKSRKPLLHCTRAACHATVHGSRGRERRTKPIQAFATKAATPPRMMSVGIQHVGPGPAAHHCALRCVRGTETGCWPNELSCPGRGAARSDAAQSRDPGSGTVAIIRPKVRFAAHDRERRQFAGRHLGVESMAPLRATRGGTPLALGPPWDCVRRRSVSRRLSDMSQFAVELCEYCADIAPIVPSLRDVP